MSFDPNENATPSRQSKGGDTVDPNERYSLARSPIFWALLVFFALFMGRWLMEDAGGKSVSYSMFKEGIAQQKFSQVLIADEWVKGILKDSTTASPPATTRQTPNASAANNIQSWRASRVPDDPELIPLLEEQKVEYTYVPTTNAWLWFLPLAIALLFTSFMIRRLSGLRQGSQGLLAFGKSRSRVQMEPNTGVTFNDVAGIDEAVEDQEIVAFLRTPEKYRRLGGKIPKGVLLVGPPGTGKTLLARAVAGAAGVPFFNLSGSEFMEMFVGVGAARVRDLFRQAQEKAPAIIFIDELDALAKSRDAGSVVGGHDEREQTLNQLLSEMDGFDPRVGLIVLGATNRPDVLDQALLRPGRFDRQVLVDRPDKRGRHEILKIHVRGVRIARDVDLQDIAARTPGFAGADLANVCNEAALLAARRNADLVYMQDFTEAIERVVAGLRRKNRRINEEEKRVVAYHEAGHAVMAMTLPNSDPVHKVSIIPHGLGALGYTMQLPSDDRYLMRLEELRDKMAGLLGGRAAEEITFDTISSGAADDLKKATDIARVMVTEYGMSEALGPIGLAQERRSFLGRGMSSLWGERSYSEETARLIDREIKRLVNEALERARRVLAEQRALLEMLAQRLLANEVIEREELIAIARSFGYHDGTTEDEWVTTTH